MNEVFDANYYELSYIEDESNWKTYFYAKKSLPHPGDFMDCSFICKSVERDNGCEMFYFEVIMKFLKTNDKLLIQFHGQYF